MALVGLPTNVNVLRTGPAAVARPLTSAVSGAAAAASRRRRQKQEQQEQEEQQPHHQQHHHDQQQQQQQQQLQQQQQQQPPQQQRPQPQRHKQQQKVQHVTVGELVSKLQKACGSGGSEELVRAAFAKFLRHGRSATGDSLSFEEFIVAVKASGIMETEHAYAMFQLMDGNANGIISFDEFASVLYGSDVHTLQWTYDKANQLLVETREKQQKDYTVRDGHTLRKRLQAAAEHVRQGEGQLRGILVGKPVDIASVRMVLRRYHIQCTEAAVRGMLEYMNPEHEDRIDYFLFVDRIFNDPVMRPRVPPPVREPRREASSSSSSNSSSDDAGITLAPPTGLGLHEHGAADVEGGGNAHEERSPESDATPALKILCTANGNVRGAPGRLLKTFRKFRQTQGARGQFVTLDDFQVALYRSGFRVPANVARDAFGLLMVLPGGLGGGPTDDVVEYTAFMERLFGSLQTHTQEAVMHSYARHMQHLGKLRSVGEKDGEVVDDPEVLLERIVQKARDDGGAHQVCACAVCACACVRACVHCVCMPHACAYHSTVFVFMSVSARYCMYCTGGVRAHLVCRESWCGALLECCVAGRTSM
jgi:Ca2+-binding EF-hand superfamily protein